MRNPLTPVILSIIALSFSPIRAGMYETPEELARQKADELAAEQQDAKWKDLGNGAIPEIIRSLCKENGNFYLREKALGRLESIGLPAIRALLKKQRGMTKDSLCEGDEDTRLNNVIASVYCNAEHFAHHGDEWKAGIELLRKKADENPEDALEIIRSIALREHHCECFQFESLAEEFLPMISNILRGNGKKQAKNASESRSYALNVIAGLGPAAAPLVKEILPFLSDSIFDAHAAEALGKIGPQASPAVNALRAAMKRNVATADKIAFVKALGEIGPQALRALPDIKRLLEHLLENACDGNNGRNIETSVVAMCKLSMPSHDFGASFFKWHTGCSSSALAEVFRQALRIAQHCLSMPVASICGAIASLGKSGAPAYEELLAFVRDNRENIGTRGAAAMALEAVGGSANLSPSDKQLVKDVLYKSRPQPIRQIPEPNDYGSRDSSTVPPR